MYVCMSGLAEEQKEQTQDLVSTTMFNEDTNEGGDGEVYN